MSEFYSIGEKVLVTNAATQLKATVRQMGCGEVLVEYDEPEVKSVFRRGAWVDIERVERVWVSVKRVERP